MSGKSDPCSRNKEIWQQFSHYSTLFNFEKGKKNVSTYEPFSCALVETHRDRIAQVLGLQNDA